MLNPEEKKEIDEEIGKIPYKESAAIDALKIVQNHRGWVSEEGLNDVADYLEMSPDSLDSIATFYNLIFRKPVGEHIIRICDSVSCYITGYNGIKQAISDHLGIEPGETTEDNKFTFLPIQCLGTCDRAPAIMVDDDLHRDLTPAKIPGILDQYK
ncbi:MAG: NADH-quinone oxidoreductase subunit NuoE [Candidatus Marinimicrobia bacterium]|nr:NADH-quinone oxidoreductase subunit NuoE [Candidatus Neomarinimicrobiota bacterium]MCF7830247.1 NADH-quinone oxidoreductase subunit NuoE [Candidatus Neomarinimicrobiota bacterium]MCF7882274.1 NADH-quinone oxidoreductase subunit NuoE [Candidatus Neomarinimicrobiota bacterium]